MKIIAAYLLAVLGGNTAPSAVDVKRILGSVGVEGEDEQIELLKFWRSQNQQLLLREVKGKYFAELIASGREKLASVPSGGGVVAVSAVSGGGAAASAPPAKAKEEKKVEEKEESDDDMGFSLFD
ncbi:60S acidic ribosomal protein P2-2 [Lathyrus oleraceus]|uniref:60S acidic ribosomal protein P2-2 n=1 Tax=Pisum sativum TaxID=3888 RepID=UPI0021CE1175|nr:60S acidic ribosomal protein P2-2-like [Pisum sativum]